MRIIAFTDGAGFDLIEDTNIVRRTIVTDVDGWFGGAEVETERTNRLYDGAISGDLHRGERKLTLSVWQECVDERATVALSQAISGAFQSNRPGSGSLTIADDWGSLTAMDLSLDGKPKVAHDRTGCKVKWEMPLSSSTPYLYGPQQSITVHSPGAGIGMRFPLFEPGYLDFGATYIGPTPEVTNEGNQVAYPVVEVNGSMPSGFQLDLIGDTTKPSVGVTFRGDVDAGRPVLIDFWTGRAVAGGADQSYLLTRRDWGGITPHGLGSVKLTSLGQGEGWADVTMRSTYA